MTTTTAPATTTAHTMVPSSEGSAAVAKTTENSQQSQVVITGVVFHRTVRSVYAILLLAAAAVNDGCEEEKVVVRLQIKKGCLAPILRSWCRRTCKIGDKITVRGEWAKLSVVGDDTTAGTEWTEERFVVDLYDEEDAEQKVFLVETRHWDMGMCQTWQKRFMVQKNNQEVNKIKRQQKIQRGEPVSNKTFRHGGLEKRKQGEQLANFLIHVMMHKLGVPNLPQPSDWASKKPPFHLATLQTLNKGTGVIDAAGGSGHVSMALGLAGIQSTVVDPRENVGKLPSKSRKVYKKARQARSNMIAASSMSADGIPLCGPSSQVVEYQALRAWFAARPHGVDTSFRHPDEESVDVCSENHELIQQCSAIVALHPDEATDAIVDMAVRKRVPFAVMPCCVFSRLFPDRRTPKGQPVRNYEELIEYLMAKDPAIQKTVLPFEGANISLWATFS